MDGDPRDAPGPSRHNLNDFFLNNIEVGDLDQEFMDLRRLQNRHHHNHHRGVTRNRPFRILHRLMRRDTPPRNHALLDNFQPEVRNDLVSFPESPDVFSSDFDDILSDNTHSSISGIDEEFGAARGQEGAGDGAQRKEPKWDFLSSGDSDYGRRSKRKRASDSSDLDYYVDHSKSRKSSRKKSTNIIQSKARRSNLVETIQNFREANEFTDVTLVVEDKEIPCHRVVLAACSHYFRAVLNSGMKEGREGRVVIQDRKYDIINMIVNHAYTQNIKITSDNAQDVLEAADYYQMDTLKHHCEVFLIRQVDETNCLGFLQFASLRSLDLLHGKAKKFAVRNFGNVSKQDEFLRLPVSVLVKYLSDDALVVQFEEHVYQAAVKWLEFDEARKSDAGVVLRSVRLFFVGTRFLFDVVTKHPLFQSADSSTILSEACKYHALGRNEWKHFNLPHTRPRASSGICEVLVVVGGICNNRRLLYTECYHPLKKEWLTLSDISTSHSSMHSYSVCSHNNDVYITGGHSNAGTTEDRVSVYLSNINQWSNLSCMQHPRERHGSASVDGAIYVAGGLMASPKNRKKPGVLDNVERYRPAYNKWEKVKSLPKRCYSPGVLSHKEKLYVIGGVSMTEEPSSSSKIILDCIQCYDPLTDSWTILPLGRPLARLSCVLYQDHFYMISNNVSFIFRYDPTTNTLEEWKELNEVNLEFAGLAAFNGKLIISGGQKESTTLNHMLVVDFETKLIEDEIKMKRSRCMHGCVPINKFG